VHRGGLVVECMQACAVYRSGGVLQLNTDRPEDLLSLFEVQTRAQCEQQLLDPSLPQQSNASILVHLRFENTRHVIVWRSGGPFPVWAQLFDSPLSVGVAAASPKLAPELQLAFIRVEIEVETRAQRQTRASLDGVSGGKIAHQWVQRQRHGIRKARMVGKGSEPQASADPSTLVQDAVVQFRTRAEATMHGIHLLCGCWFCGRNSGVRTKVVEPSQAHQRRVGAVHVLGAVFARVVLQQSEDSAAIVEVRVADSSYPELSCRCKTSQIQGFEPRLGKEYASIQQGVCCVLAAVW
jgi:hypothetical protein